MDFIAADTFSPPFRSSVDRSFRSDWTASPSSSSGIRKQFSAVLQGVRGEEGRADRGEADDVRSSNKSQNKPQVNEARGRAGSSAGTDRPDASSSKTTQRNRSDDDMDGSADVSKKGGESSAVKGDARSDAHSSDSQPAPDPTPIPIMTQTINQEQIPTKEGPRSSEDEHQATTVSSISTLVPPALSMPSMATRDAHEATPSSGGATTQSKNQPGQASAMTAHPTEGDAQADLALNGDRQALVGAAGTKTVVADVESHAASSGKETVRSLPQSDTFSRKESNLNSSSAVNSGGIDRSMSDVAEIKNGVPLVRPVSSHSEGHAPARGDKDNPESKENVILPFRDSAQSVSDDGNRESRVSASLLRGHHMNFDVTKYFVELRTGQTGSSHNQAETELSQEAVGGHQVTGGQPTAATMIGAQGGVGSSSSPPPTPTAPLVGHAQSAMPGHDPTDKVGQAMTRSVVLNLAQPDLGHVNIRVAMTNDVVHTHLSADRPEVGQFLINGQDRLQAAFQANGLDMGQFRVDIDRQSAGRSFHHGPSQEQGQTWDQGSPGMNRGHSADQQDEQRASLHSLLNVVA